MKNVPSLSDIYSKNILAQEANTTEAPLEQISEAKKAPSNVVTKKMDIGNGKDKKLVGDGPNKAKLPQKAKVHKKAKFSTMESYNTFEKLFRSTISENTDTKPEGSPQNLDFEVPVTPEELTDELETTEDEVSNLVTDLKDVVSKLNDILSKIESETEEEEESEESEADGREELDLPEPDENKVKESVESAGQALTSKKHGVVKGDPKVHGGKVHSGQFSDEPEPKPLKANDSELRSTKNQKVKTSNIKVGDFFK